MIGNETDRGFKAFVEILLVSTKLGLSSFGGPVAHLGYFHNFTGVIGESLLTLI
ncbi:MAG TPA: hypothetical protein GX497_07235 [Bacillus bacterium]|nr:hypothetical protein [Bacillus sp. (in: firmicutes)]